MKNFLFVFLGGGLGSALRYATGLFLNKNLPYGTLIANILGCLLIGLVIGLFEKQLINNNHILILAIGFCGGFTTFSSFALENIKLLQSGHIYTSIAYLSLSILIGFGFILLGFKFARHF